MRQPPNVSASRIEATSTSCTIGAVSTCSGGESDSVGARSRTETLSSKGRSRSRINRAPRCAMKRLRGGLLRVGGPGAFPGQAVHAGPMEECLLARLGVGVGTLPRTERGGLQRAAVGEGNLPRVRTEFVDRVEVGGGLLV